MELMCSICGTAVLRRSGKLSEGHTPYKCETDPMTHKPDSMADLPPPAGPYAAYLPDHEDGATITSGREEIHVAEYATEDEMLWIVYVLKQAALRYSGQES